LYPSAVSNSKASIPTYIIIIGEFITKQIELSFIKVDFSGSWSASHFLKVCFANKGTSVLEQFHSFLTKDKLATKLVNEGNKLPIAFILAL
jgi:hypothetical protein